MELLRAYYQLTKPGIIRGNLLTAFAGYMYGAEGDLELHPFIAVLVGTIFVIAAGCVFNNILDRNIDAKMQRTMKRALVTGAITPYRATIYGIALFIIGFVTLLVWTNKTTVLVGTLGFIFYVVVYGYTKRRGAYGTLVGSISGATPLLAGYTTAAGTINTTGILLFACMAAWQMPHFYAIALYRSKEYKKAGIPVLPLVVGVAATKRYILSFLMAFIVATTALFFLSNAGIVYLLIMTVINLTWLVVALKGFHAANTNTWAKQVFGTSLLVLLLFSFSLSINSYVP